MNHLITNIPENKKNKIIHASLSEFIKSGYNEASTNKIIQEAGISKGLLFHYFGSKKNLYLFLVDYCMRKAQDDYMEKLDQLSPDLIQRSMEWALEKIRLYKISPLVYAFIASVFIKIPEELKPELEEYKRRVREENRRLFLKDIDLSTLRDDINKDLAIEFLFMIREFLWKKHMDKFQENMDYNVELIKETIKEVNEYYNIFKYGAYKDIAPPSRDTEYQDSSK